MKSRHKIVFLFILVTIKLYAQKDSSNVKKFFMPLSGIGYNWQGTNNIDIGLQPTILLDAYHNHNNVGLALAANIMYYNNSTYLTPVTKIKILIHKRKQLLGWVASVGHSYTKWNKKYDHRITPEIGLHMYGFSLTAGFNIPTSAYRDGFTNYLRLGLRFNTH